MAKKRSSAPSSKHSELVGFGLAVLILCGIFGSAALLGWVWPPSIAPVHGLTAEGYHWASVYTPMSLERLTDLSALDQTIVPPFVLDSTVGQCIIADPCDDCRRDCCRS